MTGMTDYMVERMRVEIARSAADDLLTAIERLPASEQRDQAERRIREARELVSAVSCDGDTDESRSALVTVTTSRRSHHVCVSGVTALHEARNRALDALVDRHRIDSWANVGVDMKWLEPGEIVLADEGGVIWI